MFCADSLFCVSGTGRTLGRPRGRSADSSPRRRAVVLTQFASPMGLPRRRQRRTASNFCSKSDSFARATQLGSRAIGQGERSFGAVSIFCTGRQSDPQRQSSARATNPARRAPALDVTTDDTEMIVVLHGKAFEASLRNVAFARRMVVGVVAHRVGPGHPAKQLAHRTLPGRLTYPVPVVGHPLVGQQLDCVALESGEREFARTLRHRHFCGRSYRGHLLDSEHGKLHPFPPHV